MRFKGKVWKACDSVHKGKFWLIEVRALDVMTQGHTKREAFEMIADAIETLVDQPGFKVMVYPGKDGDFEISASDPGAIEALSLRRKG
jgi:environmental stress-induced protein Ves